MSQQNMGETAGSRADRIRISPSQMKSVASQFRSASEQSNQMIVNLDRQMESMKAEWEGMTRQAFVVQFEQWKKSMNNYVLLLDGINKQLVAIAERFEQAEEQAKNIISRS